LFGSYYPDVETTPTRGRSSGSRRSKPISQINITPGVNMSAPTVKNRVVPSTFKSVRDLTLESTGEDVKALQNFLISQKYSIPAGATGYYGEQTLLALSKYQKDNNIYPATGYFGPLTISFLRQNVSSLISDNLAPTNQSSVDTIYTRNLSLGSQGDDVKQLQIFLNSTQKYLVSTLGAGSVGNETTYFGLATQSALTRFQVANNIQPALGYFGPITREFVK